MEPPGDRALLRQYSENHSDDAFAALVTRHVNLVYSVALRQVGNTHQAEEIAQAVFIILSQKAPALRHEQALSSWLFQATCLTASNFVRSELRRHRREQEAYMQSVLDEPEHHDLWKRIAPVLDAAVASLNANDRRAIVLRFYEGRSLREIGAALGANEDGARKRVSRAVEKLQKFFQKRGVNSTAAAIGETISACSIQVAPVGLAKTISAMAVAKGATASTSTLTLIKGALKIMAWTKAKTAIVVGTAIIVATGTTVAIVEEMAPAGTAVERAPVAMETKWQVGKQYLMHEEDIQTTQMQNPGQSKPVKQVQNLTADLSYIPIKELDNNGWQLQMEIESLADMVTNGNHTVLAADSSQNPAQDARNPVGAMFRKMVGARLEYFTDANGVAERMNGYQELVSRAAGSNPQQQAAFKNMISEIAFENYGSFLEDTVPVRMQKLGDRWTFSMKEPSAAGDLQVDAQCHFKNWEQRANHKCMHITFTGTVSTAPGSGTSNSNLKIEKATFVGDAWWDPELGMLVERVQDLDAELKVNQNGQVQTVPYHQLTRITLAAIEDT